MSTKIDIIKKNIAIKHISWRIYHDINGNILACSPTNIPELEHYSQLHIPHETGEQINSGKINANRFSIVNVNGSYQLQEKIDIIPSLTQEQLVYQISNNVENYLIEISIQLDQNIIVFKTNVDKTVNVTDILDNISPNNFIYVVKKGDPSWLYAKIEFPIEDIFLNGVVVKNLEIDFPEDYCLLTNRLINKIKLADNNTISDDLLFYHFLNDIDIDSSLMLLKTKTDQRHILNFEFKQDSLIISLNQMYRKYIEEYIFKKNKRDINFFITNKNTPFMYGNRFTVNILDLISNDLIVTVPPNCVLLTDLKNAYDYIAISQTDLDRVSNFYADSIKQTMPKQVFNSINKRKSIFWFKKIRQTIKIELNPDFLYYLDTNRVIKGFILDNDTIIPITISIDALKEEPILIKVKSNFTKIFVEVTNENNYFYTG